MAITAARAPVRCSNSSRFAASSASEKVYACDIAARPVEAGDEAELDRVVADRKTIGMVVVAALAASAARVPSRRSRPPVGGRVRPPAPAADRIDPSAQRYSIATLLALDVAGFAQALRNAATSCAYAAGDALLRNPITGIAGCCARAASGHAAAPPSSVMNSRRSHSITSSARASSVGGTSRPSAFAVLRLMTSSNLVDCCTGRSAGFSPLRIRPA